MISAMHGWVYPAFPPQLTPERIQENLVEVRVYVANHADVMSLRPGAQCVGEAAANGEQRREGGIMY